MSSFKTDYTVYLPSYSVGADCYKEIESVVKSYGTKAVVVGGKTAMEKSRDARQRKLHPDHRFYMVRRKCYL